MAVPLVARGLRPATAHRPEPRTSLAAVRAAEGQQRRIGAASTESSRPYFDQYLALNPIDATEHGDHRFDDRFGDYASVSWMADSLGIEQESLERPACRGSAKARRRRPRHLRGVQAPARTPHRRLPLPERAAGHQPVRGLADAFRAARVGPRRASVPHDAGLRQLPRAHGWLRAVGGPGHQQPARRRDEGRRAAEGRRRAYACRSSTPSAVEDPQQTFSGSRC